MKTQFVINDEGRKEAVILPIEEYEKLIEIADEYEDIKAYDEAIKDNDEGKPMEEVFRKIEEKRKNNV